MVAMNGLSITLWIRLSALLLGCCGPAVADVSNLEYRGFIVDESALPVTDRANAEANLRQQIDLVSSLAIDPAIAAFLKSVPLRIDPTLREPGHFDRSGLRLSEKPSPADNPVLLHELLHAWLSKSSPEDRVVIRAAYEAAVRSGRYPRDAYMMSDVAEFFTMTTSVVLWGRAARLPFTRAKVEAEMPDYYRWIVKRFGLQV